MEPKKLNGLIISLIIVVLLVIGTIYLTEKNRNSVEELDTTVNQADSTELDALSNDINNTDTNTGVDVNSVQ